GTRRRASHARRSEAAHGFLLAARGLMNGVLNQLVDVFRLDLMLQLSLATLLGGAIGLERELGGKPAGLRTNILICMGSVLYTKLSLGMLGGPNGIPSG